MRPVVAMSAARRVGPGGPRGRATMSPVRRAVSPGIGAPGIGVRPGVGRGAPGLGRRRGIG